MKTCNLSKKRGFSYVETIVILFILVTITIYTYETIFNALSLTAKAKKTYTETVLKSDVINSLWADNSLLLDKDVQVEKTETGNIVRYKLKSKSYQKESISLLWSK